MFRAVLGCLLAASLILAAAAAETEELDVEDDNLYDDEGRLLVVPTANGGFTTIGLFNISSLFGAGGPIKDFLFGDGTGNSGIFPYLIALAALGASIALSTAIPLSILHHKGYCGYGTGSGSGYGSGSSSGSSYGDSGGYSSYSSYRRSFDPYAIDWEKFSIIDWIAIGEEAWRKFDPADLECQKRLICEIHQNTSRFGAPAARLVDLFSYLQYAEVLSLPDEIKALIEEYNDAADRGRSIQKDCGDVYTTCDFSVKQIMEKYSHNEI